MMESQYVWAYGDESWEELPKLEGEEIAQAWGKLVLKLAQVCLLSTRLCCLPNQASFLQHRYLLAQLRSPISCGLSSNKSRLGSGSLWEVFAKLIQAEVECPY